MLSLPPAVRIFLCTAPADMRKAFDGLAQMTREVIAQDPLSGHLFVFLNRRRDRVKILYWDRDGYALWAKRLERGTFRRFAMASDRCELEPNELALFLGGIDLAGARKRKRYVRPETQAVQSALTRTSSP